MKKDTFKPTLEGTIENLKRICPMFGFERHLGDVYTKNTIPVTYLAFNDTHLILFNEIRAFHMSYEEVYRNILLYMEDPQQGFSERTFFTKALEALEAK